MLRGKRKQPENNEYEEEYGQVDQIFNPSFNKYIKVD